MAFCLVLCNVDSTNDVSASTAHKTASYASRPSSFLSLRSSQFPKAIKSTTPNAYHDMMIHNKITTFSLIALIATGSAFTPAPGNSVKTLTAATATADLPYFIDMKESSRQDEGVSTDTTPKQSAATTIEAAPKKKATAPKKGGAVHKEGIFSPVVLAGKAILGDEQLNKVRAKAISMHSNVIASFVDTHELPAGQVALKTLFTVADKNGDGTICEDELNAALKSLGFTWLKEKQVKGIFQRADTDENGAIDFQEFMNEAPKTLRTNLAKLAKKNGGELGFLV